MVATVTSVNRATAAGTSATTPSITPTTGGVLLCLAVGAGDEGTVSAPANPGGTLSATWTAIDQVIGGASVSAGIKVWRATDHSGSGTVSSGVWTNATVANVIVGHIAADGTLTFIAAGDNQGTTGTTVTASYTDAGGVRTISFYLNATITGDTAFTPDPANTVEVEELFGNSGIIDQAWGYNDTPTIPTTLGSTIGASVTRWLAIAFGFQEEDTGTQADAGHASGTGTAESPTANLSQPVGHASGVGVANQPAGAVAKVAGHAAGTGVAHGPSVSVVGQMGHAAASGVANDVTGVTDTGVQADAGHAAGIGVANRVAGDLNQPVGHAAGTGVAFQPAPVTRQTAMAGSAAASGMANGVSADVRGALAVASAAGVAFDVVSELILPDEANIEPELGFWIVENSGLGWTVLKSRGTYWDVRKEILDSYRFSATATRFLRASVYARKDGAEFDPTSASTSQALINRELAQTAPTVSQWVAGTWETDNGVDYSRTLFDFSDYGDGVFDWWVRIEATPEDIVEQVGTVILV